MSANRHPLDKSRAVRAGKQKLTTWPGRTLAQLDTTPAACAATEIDHQLMLLALECPGRAFTGEAVSQSGGEPS
jgi:hypothetical protein